MYERFVSSISYVLFERFALGVVGYFGLGRREGALYRVVGYEEEGCARGGADDRAAYAPVYACEAARGSKARAGLEAGFECVKGVEREVDCCAC